MICIVSYGAYHNGGERLYRWPMTHTMSSLNLALQWHLWGPKVHNNSHVRMVLS